MKYTYLIVTPGVDLDTYIMSPDNAHFNYFKFGDTTQPNRLDIRNGYTSHNPDVGVCGVFIDELEAKLGTILKQEIANHAASTCHSVAGTEWFVTDHARARRLANFCLHYDNSAIDGGNLEELLVEMLRCLA
ncbi:hypothetical protein ACUN9Y_10340 [Halomonas sp. V046]|uniref:hypothetical protein n=1 Tax=Halomonas sp. V046 TaxID=3459611 RepID=UPI004044C31B